MLLPLLNLYALHSYWTLCAPSPAYTSECFRHDFSCWVLHTGYSSAEPVNILVTRVILRAFTRTLLASRLMPATGLEPVRPQGTPDFKSGASAYSATPACLFLNSLSVTSVVRCPPCNHSITQMVGVYNSCCTASALSLTCNFYLVRIRLLL